MKESWSKGVNMTESETNKSECSIEMIDEGIQVDCNARNLLKVPKNLDSNIVFLDISNNLNLELHDKDLERYTKLKTLKMQWINKFSNFSMNFFLPLSQIEILDMTGVKINNDGSMLPPTLLKYYINNSNITEFDVSHLENLMELYMAHNELVNFPIINKEAPLTNIDLRYNPLDELFYEDLAPFCLLRYLGLELPENSSLHALDKFKECCLLQSWISTYNISGVLPNLHCFSDAGAKCEATFSSAALEKREECLERNGIDQHGPSLWVIILNLFVGLILIVSISFLLYRFVYKARKMANKRRPGKRENENPDAELEVDADDEAT